MTTPQSVSHKSLLPSHEFYLAAGTVTLDRAAGKALVLLDRQTGLHGLPRGRCDWNESLRDAAVRETYEEAGVRCSLVPVPVPTRATAPPGTPAHLLPNAISGRSLAVGGACGSGSGGGGGSMGSSMGSSSRADEVDGEVVDLAGEVTRGVPLTEPFALLTHFRANGALAVVHWFVADADSSVLPQGGTQMTDEDYEGRWVPYAEAQALMPDANHADLVRRAVLLAEKLQRMRADDDDDAALLRAGLSLRGGIGCGNKKEGGVDKKQCRMVGTKANGGGVHVVASGPRRH